MLLIRRTLILERRYSWTSSGVSLSRKRQRRSRGRRRKYRIKQFDASVGIVAGIHSYETRCGRFNQMLWRSIPRQFDRSSSSGVMLRTNGSVARRGPEETTPKRRVRASVAKRRG